MTRLVDNPLLRDGSTGGIAVEKAGVGMAADGLSSFYPHVSCGGLPVAGCREPLVEQAIRIGRGDSAIAISMKDNHRDSGGKWPDVLRYPLSHCRKCGRQIMCSTVGEAGVHTDSSIEVGVCRGQNSGHSPAR